MRRQVDQLNHEAEIATEKFNEAVEKLRAAEKRLEVVQDRIATQQAKLNVLQDHLGTFAALAYRNGGIDKTLQLLTSDDPSQFLAQAATLDQISDQQADVLRKLQIAHQELMATRLQADQEIAEIEAARKEQGEHRDAVLSKLRKARALLNRLTEEERRQLYQEPVVSAPNVPASGRAAIAVNFAKAQLGEPYVWAGDGPGTWDCSGLTMMAWRAAGVSLPHSSAQQYGYGSQVSRANLEPGDLVFFYSPISHVGIYVGNGLMIHAPKPGDVVKYTSISTMPYVGAKRLG